jgi:hypothetical protein
MCVLTSDTRTGRHHFQREKAPTHILDSRGVGRLQPSQSRPAQFPCRAARVASDQQSLITERAHADWRHVVGTVVQLHVSRIDPRSIALDAQYPLTRPIESDGRAAADSCRLMPRFSRDRGGRQLSDNSLLEYSLRNHQVDGEPIPSHACGSVDRIARPCQSLRTVTEATLSGQDVASVAPTGADLDPRTAVSVASRSPFANRSRVSVSAERTVELSRHEARRDGRENLMAPRGDDM